MRDVRSMHSVVKRGGPTSETGAYVDMHRLMTEKERLERELGMWQANVQRIEARLADIDNQMKQLNEIAFREREKRNAANEEVEPFREMTMTY
jgi:Skp family chaperone for outer membrane proteins